VVVFSKGEQMSPDQIILLFAGFTAVMLAIYLIARRGGDNDETRILSETAEKMINAQAELAGRLSQLTENQATAQKLLDERLADVSRRVGESLEKTSQKAQTSMADLKERLAVIDTAQKNITELSSQVVGLQDILANKQARGAFGEIRLNDLVQNVLPSSAYETQATLSNGKRVDCLIRLPNPPGPISIDAKFPLESYHALHEAVDDAARKIAARRFGTDVMKHVRDIAEKYILPGETAETALMFLPSEAVYGEIHANFLDIVEKAFRARVVIVSPSTLWATLNTVRAVLKDVEMREQAGIIQKEVHILLEDVTRLDKRVSSLQKHFDLAEKDIREIQTSAGKITRRGEDIISKDLSESEALTEDSAASLLPPGSND
jgi:DNA recombination protein RmuC